MPGSHPRLIVRDSSGNIREVEILRTPFTLGRQSDNDLVLLDNRISRRHARILQDAQGYVIEDAGSRHGTYVNGQRVSSWVLNSNDRIVLGVTDAYELCFLTEHAVLPDLVEKFAKAAESPAPQLHHLGLLLQMAQILHHAPALEEVLTALVDSALQLADAERGMLFLCDDAGHLRPRLARGRDRVTLDPELIDYSRGVVERVAQSGREEVVLEEGITGRVTQETGIFRGGGRGIVAIPLQKHPMLETSGETILQTVPELQGVLYLDSRERATSLTGLDRQVLRTLAVEGATVIENARLFRLAREQERIRHELSLARKIQQSLLPPQLPQTGYFELQALTMPCQTIGGDYYDLIHLPGDRLGISVADVAGKGLPAAMMAVNLQGAFSAVAAGDPELAELFGRVNNFLCERTPTEMFATLFYGVLHPVGRFEFVNAGHPAPLVVRTNGAVHQLEALNFPLGLFPGVAFEVDSVQLDTGDLVLIFSDGVTEAPNARREFFGETRLRTLLEGCAGQPAHEVHAKVAAAVQEFVSGGPQADDLTLIVLRFGPGQNLPTIA